MLRAGVWLGRSLTLFLEKGRAVGRRLAFEIGATLLISGYLTARKNGVSSESPFCFH